jgi:hypothetical protein
LPGRRTDPEYVVATSKREAQADKIVRRALLEQDFGRSYSRTVGHIRYDGERFEFEDRLLAHLQVVISMKLRRSESFFLSWAPKAGSGEGRHAIWIAGGVPIHFAYSGSRPPAINREWVEILTLATNSSSGLVITDETVPHPVVHQDSSGSH